MADIFENIAFIFLYLLVIWVLKHQVNYMEVYSCRFRSKCKPPGKTAFQGPFQKVGLVKVYNPEMRGNSGLSVSDREIERLNWSVWQHL